MTVRCTESRTCLLKIKLKAGKDGWSKPFHWPLLFDRAAKNLGMFSVEFGAKYHLSQQINWDKTQDPEGRTSRSLLWGQMHQWKVPCDLIVIQQRDPLTNKIQTKKEKILFLFCLFYKVFLLRAWNMRLLLMIIWVTFYTATERLICHIFFSFIDFSL